MQAAQPTAVTSEADTAARSAAAAPAATPLPYGLSAAPAGRPPSRRPHRPRSPAQPPSPTSRASPPCSPPKTPCPLSAWTWTARRTSSPSNGRGRATTSSRTRSAPKSGSTPLITATSPPPTRWGFGVETGLVAHPLDAGKLIARIGFQAPHLPDDRPLNVTLVLDASGSMANGNRVDIARAAAEAIRQSLRPAGPHGGRALHHRRPP